MHYTHRFSIKPTARDARGTATEYALWDAQERKFSDKRHASQEAARDHFLEVQAHFAKRSPKAHTQAA